MSKFSYQNLNNYWLLNYQKSKNFFTNLISTKSSITIVFFKIVVLLSLFIVSLLTLFRLDSLFFASEKIGITNILHLNTPELKLQNSFAIFRSTIIYLTILVVFFNAYKNLNKYYKDYTKIILWSISNLLPGFVAIFSFFFYTYERSFQDTASSFGNLFFFSLIWIYIYAVSLSHFLFVEKRFLKLSSYNNVKIKLINVNYYSKIFTLLIFYVIFGFLAFSGNQAAKVFENNAIIDTIDRLLENVNRPAEIVIIFFLSLAGFTLFALNNLSFLFYAKESKVIRNHFANLTQFALVIFASVLIWYSTVAFGIFPNLNSILNPNAQQLPVNFYVVVAINALLVIVYYILKSLRVSPFLGVINSFFLVSLFILLSWLITMISVSVNQNDYDTYKVIWSSLWTSGLLLIDLVARMRKNLLNYQIMSIVLFLVNLIVLTVMIGFRIILINNNNFLDLDLSNISFVTKLIVYLFAVFVTQVIFGAIIFYKRHRFSRSNLKKTAVAKFKPYKVQEK